MKHAVVGIGNWGFWLAKRLTEIVNPPSFIISRNKNRYQALASEIGAELIEYKELMTPRADTIYWCCLPDDVALAWYKKTNPRYCVFASGAITLPVLSPDHHVAVAWPIMSISKQHEPDWSKLPLVIQHPISPNEPTEFINVVMNVGQMLSAISPTRLSSEAERKALHLGAVLTQNFSNALWAVTHRIAQQQQVDYRLLLPLVNDHLSKLQHASPIELQTGPAKRRDSDTMRTHQELLTEVETDVYRALSKLIQAQHKY